MEAAVVRLEESVLKADKRLDTIAWKLDEYEKQVVHVDGNEHATQCSTGVCAEAPTECQTGARRI